MVRERLNERLNISVCALRAVLDVRRMIGAHRHVAALSNGEFLAWYLSDSSPAVCVHDTAAAGRREVVTVGTQVSD